MRSKRLLAIGLFCMGTILSIGSIISNYWLIPWADSTIGQAGSLKQDTLFFINRADSILNSADAAAGRYYTVKEIIIYTNSTHYCPNDDVEKCPDVQTALRQYENLARSATTVYCILSGNCTDETMSKINNASGQELANMMNSYYGESNYDLNNMNNLIGNFTDTKKVMASTSVIFQILGLILISGATIIYWSVNNDDEKTQSYAYHN